MMAKRKDKIITLADGRRLGFAEYGEANGLPLLFFHGTPGSRIMAGLAGAKAKELGLRLIAPDRPGFGLSDFQPRRRLADWARDVEELMDYLKLDRFAVVGVSGGGPYAAACAWKFGERVTGVGIISGLAPEDRVRGDLSQAHRLVVKIMRRPFLIYPLLSLLGRWARRRPEIIIKIMRLPTVLEDRRILANPEVQRILTESAVEALRGGPRGTAFELALFSRPWGFQVEDIIVPVYLWHGEADAIVPVVSGRYLADHIPRCGARFIPGEGHLWIFKGYKEVLEVLQRNMSEQLMIPQQKDFTHQ